MNPIIDQNPQMRRQRWLGVFRETWADICSAHHPDDQPDPNCPRCRAGHWTNDVVSDYSQEFYKRDPSGWQKWANQPGNPSFAHLERIFLT